MSSSLALPSTGFRYKPHLPLRLEANAILAPSGDHNGDELSWAASKVKRCIRPCAESKNQLSPPVPSWTCTATRFPSGDRSTPAYAAGPPTCPTLLPARSIQNSVRSATFPAGWPGAAAPVPTRYVRTPVSDTPKLAERARLGLTSALLLTKGTLSATRTGSPFKANFPASNG